MRIAVNCTTLAAGGGIQVALSLLKEFEKFEDYEFHVFYSNSLRDKIKINDEPDNFFFYFFPNSPARLKQHFAVVRKLKKLEKKINPDCVLTVFGPSYWRPKSPHLMGYAMGYYLYPDSPFWKNQSFKEKIKQSIVKKIKLRHAKKNSDYFHVETEDAKLRLCRVLKISSSKILVASNTYHPVFNEKQITGFNKAKKESGEFKLLCLSAYYRHKNLNIIPAVLKELNRKSEINFKFYLTLKESDFQSQFKNCKNIINLRPVQIQKCPELYEMADAVFVPTLVEIFTANYVEAMKMEVPILTSDLPFAHDLCSDSALYFDPLGPEDIAEKIIKLAKDPKLRIALVKSGKKRLKSFDTPYERAKKILKFCREISSQCN